MDACTGLTFMGIVVVPHQIRACIGGHQGGAGLPVDISGQYFAALQFCCSPVITSQFLSTASGTVDYG